MARVRSEVGRLEQVLVHEPGPEVDRMVPDMMEDLLFDDIVFGEDARREHKAFRDVMTTLGVEVLEAQDLLVEALALPEGRAWILETLVHGLPAELRKLLERVPAQDLANILIAGLRADPKAIKIDPVQPFEISPLPNWCFQRDPQIVIGDGVLFSAMCSPARWRESLLTRLMFNFHPRLRETPVLLDPVQPQTQRLLLLGHSSPSLEGGDVLVLSPDVLAVGFSERTNRAGIQLLARALSQRKDGPRSLVMVALPQERSYMHLDTVFCPIDHGACLVFPPVMLAGGHEEAAVFLIDLRSESFDPVPKLDFLSTLKELGLRYEAIPCGGSDTLAQQREQWTDGSNALALAPGVITLYDRNVATAEELTRHGFKTVAASEIIEGKVKVDLERPERTCILVPSHEICRARGGPHCLAHPLSRAE
jgi:arginine deiminase